MEPALEANIRQWAAEAAEKGVTHIIVIKALDGSHRYPSYVPGAVDPRQVSGHMDLTHEEIEYVFWLGGDLNEQLARKGGCMEYGPECVCGKLAGSRTHAGAPQCPSCGTT